MSPRKPGHGERQASQASQAFPGAARGGAPAGSRASPPWPPYAGCPPSAPCPGFRSGDNYDLMFRPRCCGQHAARRATGASRPPRRSWRWRRASSAFLAGDGVVVARGQGVGGCSPRTRANCQVDRREPRSWHSGRRPRERPSRRGRRVRPDDGPGVALSSDERPEFIRQSGRVI